MFFETEIKTVAELLKELAQLDIKDLTWFRGQSRKNWKLVPSLGRKRPGIAAEMAIIKRFKQNAGPFLGENRPRTTWDWLMLMQHHRASTRLLDWTESPLVGLYFAVGARPRSDGALWCLVPRKLNAHANIEFGFAAELPSLGDDQEVLRNYTPETIGTERLSALNPLAVTGPRDTPRMYAQLGTFTITQRQQIAVEDVADGSHVGRFVIPATSKRSLQAELDVLKITRLTLFPELENVAELSRDVLS